MYSHRSFVLRLNSCAAALALLLLHSSAATGQSTKNPELWKWTEDADHLHSIVQVSMNGSKATGVVVRVEQDVPKAEGLRCFVLTAYHVVEPERGSDPIVVTYRDGTQAESQIADFDETHDVALLSSWAPKDVKPASVSTVRVKDKMYLEFAGLGGGADLAESLRHFSGHATQPTNTEFIYADQTLLPGDSGGPIFNRRRELVGIISGGWFWWDAGIVSREGIPVMSTWPARACNIDVIQKLLSGTDQKISLASKPDRIVDK